MDKERTARGTLVTRCPQCAKGFRTASVNAGRNGKCPSCGCVFLVSAADFSDDHASVDDGLYRIKEGEKQSSVLERPDSKDPEGSAIASLGQYLPRKCLNCGSTLPTEGAVCVQCGYSSRRSPPGQATAVTRGRSVDHSQEQAEQIGNRIGKGVICLVVLAALGVGGLYTLNSSRAPTKAFNQLEEHARKGEWDRVYDRIDKKSQAKMDIGLEILAHMAAAFNRDDSKSQELTSLKGRELFISLMKSRPDLRNRAVTDGATVINQSVNTSGDTATLQIKFPDNSTQSVTMIKEDGAWKLSIDCDAQEAAPTEDQTSTLKVSQDAGQTPQNPAPRQTMPPPTDPNAAASARPRTSGGRSPIAVALLDKGFDESNFRAGVYQDQLTFSLRFVSSLTRAVRAFTSFVIFKDLFGREIYRLHLTFEDGLRAFGQADWGGSFKYNQFIDAHRRLRSIAMRDLVVDLELEEVLYTDGTRQKF